MTNLFFSPYELKKAAGGVQTGCLLKVQKGEYFGVADISPKENLGDLNWETEISTKGPLFRRALVLAQEDLAAREAKISLLLDLPIENNLLVTDFKLFELSPKVVHGTLKIKSNGETQGLINFLSKVVSLNSNVILRIDFNNSLTPAEFDIFLNQIPPQIKNQIEYIEDPSKFSEKWYHWNQIIPLGFDIQNVKYNSDFAKFRILKPAREDELELLHQGGKFTWTSSMDHPVGVAHALRKVQAWQIKSKSSPKPHGLLTLDLFIPDLFHEAFSVVNRSLNFSPTQIGQYGIGFNEPLKNLVWFSTEELKNV